MRAWKRVESRNQFLRIAECPLIVFETVGRLIVDFGFASLLDKFEEFYGRRPAKVLIGLVGAAVVVVCLGLIWNFVFPIYAWATGTVTGISFIWLFWRSVSFIASMAFLICAGFWVSSAFDIKRMLVETELKLEDSNQLLNRVVDIVEFYSMIFDRASKIQNDHSSMLKETKGLIQELGKDNNITPEILDEMDKIISYGDGLRDEFLDFSQEMKLLHERVKKVGL